MVQVPVQPLAHIAITVQIVFAPVGIQTQHIGILLRIHPEPIFPAITAEAAFRRPPAIGRQCAAVFQHAAVILIKAKGVDNIIKRSFEILCFQIRTEIKKGAEKAFAVAAHVPAEVSNQSGLHGNLLALRIAVIPFFRGHCPYCHIH